MRTIKTLAAIAAVAVTGAFAAQSATAAPLTPTQVTIKGQNGDYEGTVKSSDANCANDRNVLVYKMLGSTPEPSSDKKIGMDTSEFQGGKYVWSAGNTGYKHGKFYSRVKKTDDCGGDLSPVIVR
jgi:hypothetical protein